MGYEKIEEPQNYPELAIYAIWRASGIRYILTANVSPTVHGSHRFPANGGRESVHVATTETKQTLTTPPVPSLASSDSVHMKGRWRRKPICFQRRLSLKSTINGSVGSGVCMGSIPLLTSL